MAVKKDVEINLKVKTNGAKTYKEEATAAKTLESSLNALLEKMDVLVKSNQKMAESLGAVAKSTEQISKQTVGIMEKAIKYTGLSIAGYVAYRQALTLNADSFKNLGQAISGATSNLRTFMTNQFNLFKKDPSQYMIKMAFNFREAFKVGVEDSKKFAMSFREIFNAKNFAGLFEVISAGAPSLQNLALILAQMGVAGNSAIIGLTSLAGVVGVALVVAIERSVHYLGQLAFSFGKSLADAMEEFSKKASEVKVVVNNLSFTIKGFTRELGKEAVGTEEYWGTILSSMLDTTKYTTKEISKAIAFLVKEGTSLGLSVEQNSVILQRAADIAAANGIGLQEVTSAMLNALAGNSQALFNMGIDVRDVALSHSKYVEEAGKTVEQLSALEKQQARYDLLLKKSNGLLGSAANELTQVAGIYAVIDRELESVKVKLGEQGFITLKLLDVQLRLTKALNNMSPAFYDILGALQDTAGVFFMATGIILKHVFTVLTVATAYKLLTASIVKTTVVNNAANASFSFLGSVLNFQAVKIKTLSDLFLNLGKVARGILAAGVTFVSAAFAKLGSSIMITIRAVTPFLLKFGLIAVAVYAVVEGFKKVYNESEQLQKTVAMLGVFVRDVADYFLGLFNSSGKSATALSMLSTALKVIINLIVNLGAIVASQLVKGISSIILTIRNVVSAAMESVASVIQFVLDSLDTLDKGLTSVGNRIKAAFGKNVAKDIGESNFKMLSRAIGDAVSEFNEMTDVTDGVVKTIEEMDSIAMSSLGSIASLTDTTAYAASMLAKKMGDNNKAHKDNREEIEKLVKLNMQYFDKTLEAQKILGDEYSQAHVKYMEAQKELAKAENMVAHAAEKAKSIAEARQTLYRAELEIQKLRQDKIKQIADQSKQMELERLKNAGLLVEATRKEFDEKIRVFLKEEERIKGLGRLSEEQKKIFQEGWLELLSAKESAIQQANIEQLRKSIGSLTDDLKRYQDLTVDITEELNKQGKSQWELISIEEQSHLAKIKTLESDLMKMNQYDARAQNIVDGFRAATKAKADFARQEVGILDMPLMSFDSSMLSKAKESISKLFTADGFMQAAGQAWDYVKGKFGSLTLADIGKGIASFSASLASFVSDLFSGAFVDQLADFAEAFAQLPEKLIGAFERLDKIMTTFINALPTFIQKLVEQVPKLVQAIIEKLPAFTQAIIMAMVQIAKILAEAAPELITALMQAFAKLIEQMPNILIPLIRALPKIAEAIVRSLPMIITEFFKAMPIIVQEFIKAIPEVIVQIAEHADEIVLALVEGLVGSMGEIAVAFIEEMLLHGGLEKIVGAILRAIPRIAWALIEGLWKGFLRVGKAIQGMLTGRGFKMPPELKEFPKKVEEGLKKAVKNISRESSQLFAVKDMEEAFKGGVVDTAKQKIDAIADAAVSKVLNAWEQLVEAWRSFYNQYLKPIVDALTTVWRSIWAGIKSFVEMLKTAWTTIWTNIQQLGTIVMTAFQWVIDNILAPLGAIVATAFQWVVDKVINPLAGVVSTAFQWVVDKVITPIVNAINSLTKFSFPEFKFPSLPSFSWPALPKWSWPSIPAPEWLSKLSIGGGGGGGGGGGTLQQIGSALGLALGGEVKPIYRANGGPIGTDTVPLWGTPGEFMVRKEVAQPNLGFLKAMNAGQAVGGLSVGNITVNAQTSMTPESIKREIVPALIKEIKRKSMDGERILSPKGVW